MRRRPMTAWRARARARQLLPALATLALFTSATCRSEFFGITAGPGDASFYVGNNESNFLVGRKDVDASGCGELVTTSVGSTEAVDPDEETTQVLHSAVFDEGRGLLFATGTTRADFDSSALTRDKNVAVVVYNADLTISDIAPKSFDLAVNLDNVGEAIAFGQGNDVLVAVHGSVPRAFNSRYESRLLQLDGSDLSLITDHDLGAGILTSFMGAGPKVLDFVYEEDSNSVVCVGSVIGAGIIWRYDLTTRSVRSFMEFNNFQASGEIGAVLSENVGEYYVTGSSSSVVNLDSNKDYDAEFVDRSEIHTYVTRIEGVGMTDFQADWTRQLSGAGSQSGTDIIFDPETRQLLVVGVFDETFSFTDALTGVTFTVDAVTGNKESGDVFLWALDAFDGQTIKLNMAEEASTENTDTANALFVNSARSVEIAGVATSTLGEPTVCNSPNLLPSVSPSPSPSSSAPASAVLLPSAVPSSTGEEDVEPIANTEIGVDDDEPQPSAEMESPLQEASDEEQTPESSDDASEEDVAISSVEADPDATEKTGVEEAEASTEPVAPIVSDEPEATASDEAEASVEDEREPVETDEPMASPSEEGEPEVSVESEPEESVGPGVPPEATEEPELDASQEPEADASVEAEASVEIEDEAFASEEPVAVPSEEAEPVSTAEASLEESAEPVMPVASKEPELAASQEPEAGASDEAETSTESEMEAVESDEPVPAPSDEDAVPLSTAEAEPEDSPEPLEPVVSAGPEIEASQEPEFAASREPEMEASTEAEASIESEDEAAPSDEAVPDASAEPVPVASEADEIDSTPEPQVDESDIPGPSVEADLSVASPEEEVVSSPEDEGDAVASSEADETEASPEAVIDDVGASPSPDFDESDDPSPSPDVIEIFPPPPLLPIIIVTLGPTTSVPETTMQTTVVDVTSVQTTASPTTIVQATSEAATSSLPSTFLPTTFASTSSVFASSTSSEGPTEPGVATSSPSTTVPSTASSTVAELDEPGESPLPNEADVSPETSFDDFDGDASPAPSADNPGVPGPDDESPSFSDEPADSSPDSPFDDGEDATQEPREPDALTTAPPTATLVAPSATPVLSSPAPPGNPAEIASPAPLPSSNLESNSPQPVPSDTGETSSPAPVPSSAVETNSPQPVPSEAVGTATPVPVPSPSAALSSPTPTPSEASVTSSPVPSPSSAVGTSSPQPVPSESAGVSSPAPSSSPPTGSNSPLPNSSDDESLESPEPSSEAVEPSSEAQEPEPSSEGEGPPLPSSSPNPQQSSTASASPTASATALASPGPRLCVFAKLKNESLESTRSFERVNIQIQMAGRLLTNRCGFTEFLMNMFIELSANNTDSLSSLWHVTHIHDGPPVDVPEVQLVLITPAPSPSQSSLPASPSPAPEEGGDSSPSPSPSPMAPLARAPELLYSLNAFEGGISSANSSGPTTSIYPENNTVLASQIAGFTYAGSVILNITAYLDPLSTELVFGSYVNFIESQQAVSAMNDRGITDIEWVGLLRTPEELDNRAAQNQRLPMLGDRSIDSEEGVFGVLTAVIAGSSLLIGLAGVVAIEALL